MEPVNVENYTESYPAVPERLRSELQRLGEGAAVVHAGHYMLYVAKDGHASDYLENGAEPGAAIEGFEFFTRMTWKLACDAIQQEARRRPDLKLMVLANDWQCLNWQGVSRRESERRAAQAREAYYARQPGLPEYHEWELKSHGLGPESVLGAFDGNIVFSESRLRDQLSRTIKEIMKDEVTAERLGLHRYFDERGEPLIRVQMSECTCAPIVLVQSGHTGCAGEVVELLNQLQQRGVRNFINLYPAQCRIPVQTGTDLAIQLFGLSGMAITNVAIWFSEPHLGVVT